MTKPIKPPSDGLCLGKTDLFFQPPSRTRQILDKEREALRLCRECPQMEQCREYALHYEMFGIWGGTTERERRYLRKELNITCTPYKPGSMGVLPC